MKHLKNIFHPQLVESMDVGPVDTECQLYDYINYCFTTYTCRERLGEKLLIRMVADVAE